MLMSDSQATEPGRVEQPTGLMGTNYSAAQASGPSSC